MYAGDEWEHYIPVENVYAGEITETEVAILQKAEVIKLSVQVPVAGTNNEDAIQLAMQKIDEAYWLIRSRGGGIGL